MHVHKNYLHGLEGNTYSVTHCLATLCKVMFYDTSCKNDAKYCYELETKYAIHRFEPLEQTYDVIHRVQEWVARKSTQLQSPHNLVCLMPI